VVGHIDNGNCRVRKFDTEYVFSLKEYDVLKLLAMRDEWNTRIEQNKQRQQSLQYKISNIVLDRDIAIKKYKELCIANINLPTVCPAKDCLIKHTNHLCNKCLDIDADHIEMCCKYVNAAHRKIMLEYNFKDCEKYINIYNKYIEFIDDALNSKKSGSAAHSGGSNSYLQYKFNYKILKNNY